MSQVCTRYDSLMFSPPALLPRASFLACRLPRSRLGMQQRVVACTGSPPRQRCARIMQHQSTGRNYWYVTMTPGLLRCSYMCAHTILLPVRLPHCCLQEQAAAAGLGVPVSVHGPMGQPVAHATSSRHIEVPPTMGGRRSSVESGGTPPGGRRSSLEGSSRSLRRSSLTMNSKSTGEGLVAQPAAQLPPPPPPAGLPPPPPPPPAR